MRKLEAALGDRWATNTALSPSRPLVVACLRQGLRMARDHRLNDLGRLIEAAFVHTDDSVRECPALPASIEGEGLAQPCHRNGIRCARLQ
ncbi:hypothetical protein ACFYXM_32385 [Streptomyces sp. NPDC002476]|uniref:hypothetical protein n=1 Tax=Streptomyces sp. NPDC002476 TaxID=3364648 RepID=UPI00367D90FB